MVLTAIGAALTVLPAPLLWATTEGAIFSVVWIIFMVLARRFAGRRPPSQRLSIDVAIVLVGAVAFVLGGLYWVPAAVVFAVADRLGLDVVAAPTLA